MNRRLGTPKVKDVLVKTIIAFKPDFTSLDAIKIFNDFKITSAPVINDEKKLIGYLSERDCIRYLVNSLFYDESRMQTVDMIMEKNVKVAQCNWDLFELEDFFASNEIRSAPVVNSDKQLVGIVSRIDSLLALENCIRGREEYKTEIKTPIELNLSEKTKMIVNRAKVMF